MPDCSSSRETQVDPDGAGGRPPPLVARNGERSWSAILQLLVAALQAVLLLLEICVAVSHML